MDELVNNYIVLERYYLRNNLIKGLETDNQEYVKNIAKVYDQDKFDSAPEVLDFIDDFCFILDKCSKRVITVVMLISIGSWFIEHSMRLCHH